MNPIFTFIKNAIYLGFERYGRYYSSYRGYVIENADPNYQGRIKVMVPQISSDTVIQNWAYPKGFYGGKEYGYQLLPPKGTVVWVEFEQGDPNFPMWSYSYRNKDYIEDEFKSYTKAYIKTPYGHVIEIEDDKENPHIKLLHSDKLSILIDKEKMRYGKLDSDKQPIPLGNKTQQELETLKQWVKAINDALTQSQTSANDGGATYKGQIAGRLSGVNQPNFSKDNILSKIHEID